MLGIHPLAVEDEGWVVRAFVPWASSIHVVRGAERARMDRIGEGHLFEARFPEEESAFLYTLSVTDREGREWPVEDPYRLGPALDESRARAFLVGDELRVHEVLGARPLEHEGHQGVLFAVWAPHARSVGLMGDLNGWDARAHPMRPRGATGMWELFVPGIRPGARYKYRILTPGGEFVEKADPCGRAVELRPATASEVWADGAYQWNDDDWLAKREARQADGSPMSIYEVHLGSWKHREGREPGWLSYRELADELIPYVVEMGFTHIELLPVLEHPLDQSWGYQPLGFFAPTSRHGTPDDFRTLIDRAHQAGLGVILDWVPGHFPTDAHGLARFDGTELYEHPDPRQALHPDWGTLTFDFGKPAVRSFLVSSAIHWLEDYHLDGLRVDAVASMLYLDYSRGEGEWSPNEQGGRENLRAVEFLGQLNDAVHRECPGALMIAEESTAWPGVSHGTDRGGLGFDRKWNMGWMNDTLEVFSSQPSVRSNFHDRLTFSIVYAHSERFILPFSHDEVVHGKRSLLARMPGRPDQKRAGLRMLLAYQWSHPGQKLLFMGGELGQWTEWNADAQLDWALLDLPEHAGLRDLVTDLNAVYTGQPSLHRMDFRPEGFEWLDAHDAERGTISYVRWAEGWEAAVCVAVNLGSAGVPDYRLPAPGAGSYRVLLDTDDEAYGGSSGDRAGRQVAAEPVPLHGRDFSVALPLAPLSAVFLVPREIDDAETG